MFTELMIIPAILLVGGLLFLSVKVVPEYQRLVIFRLGRANASLVKGPGLTLVLPLIDRALTVDLRTAIMEVPAQTAITRDNAPISIDFLVYWRIADPLTSLLKVNPFDAALLGLAATSLRAVIGGHDLDEVLSKREQMNEQLKAKIEETVRVWGGEISSVEIREITPPAVVQDAMNRQLSAERTRRAAITESEGQRQSAINIAEGEKQSAILRAEGERQSAILRAEAVRQAKIIEAQGEAEALTAVNAVAKDIDERTLLLQRLETLQVIGASDASKIVVPAEIAGLAGTFTALVESAKSGK
jgi:regulator of protease activity HflC (stomatin/prohibitin superfamily)